jgi:hypothetical protein
MGKCCFRDDVVVLRVRRLPKKLQGRGTFALEVKEVKIIPAGFGDIDLGPIGHLIAVDIGIFEQHRVVELNPDPIIGFSSSSQRGRLRDRHL